MALLYIVYSIIMGLPLVHWNTLFIAKVVALDLVRFL